MSSSSLEIKLSHRVVASLLTFLFLTAAIVAGTGVQAAHADSIMSLTATNSASILTGGKANVSLSTNNTSGTSLYNLSYSTELPTGVTYAGGSTVPATVGDPKVVNVTVVPDPAFPLVTVSHQVLIWSNVSDLVANDTSALSFDVSADPAIYPVGSTFSAISHAYAHDDPRYLPKFDSVGQVVAGSYTNSDTKTPTATQISAIKLTKTQPNPETELMRGVHDKTSTFTVKVENNSIAPTNGVVVVDYLPAQLEFLGCGGVDNSTGVEYSGSASLAATPVISANCPAPTSVSTVTNPAGRPAGVYTRIEWNLANFATGQTKTITYAVAIPLYANTATFAGGTPSATSLTQTANLNNNTGASTRQIGEGSVYSNYAIATGTYTGAVASGSSTTATSSDSASVQSSDISVVETASTNNFVSNQIFTYDLMVRTSEYAASSDIVVTDTLPNGICPIVPVGTPINGTMPSDCAPSSSGTVTGATITSVTVNSNGSFTITFAHADQAINLTTHIIYTAKFRGNYDGGMVDPTASGDKFTNGATITATSTAVAATGITPATQTVTDGSGTTQQSSVPTIDKRILPRTDVTSAADCKANYGSYVDSPTVAPNFVKGDRICFQLTVNFSTTTETRNAKVTDFVPTGTTYEGYSVGTTDEGSTVPTADVAAPTGTTVPTFRIGHFVGSDTTNRFVTKGQKLVIFVSAIVGDASTGTTPDITANLMKYSQQNTAGTALSLRDSADFGIAPAPTMTLDKGITNLNGAVKTAPYPTTGAIQGGQYADFSLTAHNTGTATIGNDQPVFKTVVWDALPLPVTCADVTNITPAGTCYDNYAGLTGTHSGQSAIVWTLNAPIAAGANSPAMTYRVTFPATGMNVSTNFTNDASIVSFNIDSTDGAPTVFRPTASLDTANTAEWNAVAANANATVTTPNVTVLKSLTSPVVVPNNTAANAVAGELVNYTYSVSIPANTTVYNARLQDTLPTGLVKLAGTSTTTTVPNGVTTYTGTTYSTAFDTTYTNTTNAAQVFSTTITGIQVAPATALTSITNTATFKSDTKATGGTALTDRTATAALPVVKPTPTITKVVSPTTTGAGASTLSAVAGQDVTFTLTVNNGTTAPAGYDTVVNDCLPNGLTFVADVNLPTGVTRAAPVAGTGTGATQNGCATTTRLIQYTLGTLAPNTPIVLKFTATVDSTSAGLASYANTARVLTSTLNDGVRDTTTEGVITSGAGTATVNVAGGSVTKTTTKPLATIGETVPYTITATIPANVNFYNAAVIDTVPAGIQLTQSGTVITCSVAGTGADCLSDLPSGGSTMTATSTKSGWYLGTISSSSSVRTITITVPATVRSIVGNVIGASLSNTAQLSWMDAVGAAPANAGSTFNKNTTVNAGSTAVTVVQEPSLTIAKTNSNATPRPGANFDYSVKVTNANNTNTSTAYNATVTDVVPSGVIVDSATITNGGTLTGATANGGGTITWTGLTITKNQTLDLTYTATLASSTGLNTAALVNTAKVTTYSSLSTGGRTYTTSQPTAASTVTPVFPAVTLGKVPNNGTVAYSGQPFAWKLTMTNAVGAGNAASVTPTDVLPENWTYQTGSAYITYPGTSAVAQVDPVSAVIVDGVQTLVWAPIASFAGGDSATIVYNAIPSADALTSPGIGQGNAHTNVLSAVTKDATGADHNSVGSYTSANVSANAFIGSADIEIQKNYGSILVAGDATNPNAWTLLVKNNGADVAVGQFTVTDTPTLPTGVTIGQPSGSGWSCTVPTVDGDFTCTRLNVNDTLASGTSFPMISVPATAAADVVSGTEIENEASVSALTTDPDLTNNIDTSVQSVTTSSDLRVTKTTSGALSAGQTATWTVNVSNAGPSLSHAPVTVTETLPAGVTNATATGTGWTCAAPVAGVITCTMDDLMGVAPTITVSADIPASFTGDITNTVSVSGGEDDPTPANNTASTTDTVDSDTTINVGKSLTSGDVVAGGTSTYRIDINNSGLADARNVSFTDALPNGLTYAGGVVDIDGAWTCSETSTSPSTVECELDDNLAPSATASVSFNVNVPSSLPLGTDVVNSATGTADNAADDTDDASGTPAGVSDLAVTKTHTGNVVAGENISYSINVKNNGVTDNNGDITVTDTLPTGMTVVSVTGNGWVCATNASDTAVDCVWDAGLANGASATTITVVVHVAANVLPSTLVNNATVEGSDDYSDSDITNNSANDETVVTRSSNVTISKTGEAVLVPGTDTTYTISVTNSGSSNAANAKVVDELPAGLTPVSIDGTGWTCVLATFTCTDTELSVGTTTITVVAHVTPSVATDTDLVNSATVTWAGTGVNSGTDTASGATAASADLAITKTAHDATVKAGTATKFDLSVQNLGTSDAVGDIIITDTLPAGTSFIGASSAGSVWDCAPTDADSQVIECVLADNAGLVADGTATLLTIDVQLDSDLPAGSLTNTASVVSGTTDPDTDNNTDTAVINVGQEVDLTVIESLVDGTPRIGNRLSFGYEVSNNGPSDAQDVVVTVKMPAGLTEIDSEGSDSAWTCVVGTADASGTEVVCTLTGVLASGADAPALVLNATIAVAAYPDFTNTVNVSTSTPETNLDNNEDSLALAVPALVGLSIVKEHVGVIQAGEQAHYVITVSNDGLTEAPNGFTVTDTLPKTLAYKSYEGEGVTCTVSGNIVTCVFTDVLAVGASATVDIFVDVAKDATGNIVNVAAVTSPDENGTDSVVTDSDTGSVLPPTLAQTGDNFPIMFVIWLIIAAIIVGGVLLYIRRRNEKRVERLEAAV